MLEGVGVFRADLIPQLPDRAVDDEQIEPSVVVVVQKPRAESREAKSEQTGLDRPVFEEARRGLNVEGVRLVVEIGHEQVVVPIAIEVPEIHTHAALRLSHTVDGNAGQKTFVLEGAGTALVDEEVIGITVVRNVYVGPPITVHVGGDRRRARVRMTASCQNEPRRR